MEKKKGRRAVGEYFNEGRLTIGRIGSNLISRRLADGFRQSVWSSEWESGQMPGRGEADVTLWWRRV